MSAVLDLLLRKRLDAPSSTAATHPLVPSALPASSGSRCTSCMQRHEPSKNPICMRSGLHAIHASSLCHNMPSAAQRDSLCSLAANRHSVCPQRHTARCLPQHAFQAPLAANLLTCRAVCSGYRRHCLSSSGDVHADHAASCATRCLGMALCTLSQ
jgi:hypothetical protein